MGSLLQQQRGRRPPVGGAGLRSVLGVLLQGRLACANNVSCAGMGNIQAVCLEPAGALEQPAHVTPARSTPAIAIPAQHSIPAHRSRSPPTQRPPVTGATSPSASSPRALRRCQHNRGDGLGSFAGFGAKPPARGRVLRGSELEPTLRHRATEWVRHRQELGDDDPATLHVAHELGLLYQESGELDRAQLLVEWAYDGRRHVLGLSHPDTLISMWAVAIVRGCRGELESAAAVLEPCVRGMQANFGSSHPYTESALEWLAALRQSESHELSGMDPAAQLQLPDPGPEPTNFTDHSFGDSRQVDRGQEDAAQKSVTSCGSVTTGKARLANHSGQAGVGEHEASLPEGDTAEGVCVASI